jgi:tripartite-type tricarboxylate transporter receptor subunit TctC
MNDDRTRLASLLAALLLFGRSHRQDYPTSRSRSWSPTPRRGPTSWRALVGQQLGERLKQPVVVENKGGGSNTIGMRRWRPPEGWLHAGSRDARLRDDAVLMKNHPYDPLKDFEPVAMIGFSPMVLCVHPSVPAKTTQEFIALAKAKPGSLNFASLGAATTRASPPRCSTS